MKRKLMLGLAAALAFGAAVQAKLPAPAEEQKAKAEEAKAKAAHGNKVADYLLCKAQNRVAERYVKEKGAKGGSLPACQDPGPFQMTAAPPAAAPAAAPKK